MINIWIDCEYSGDGTRILRLKVAGKTLKLFSKENNNENLYGARPPALGKLCP